VNDAYIRMPPDPHRVHKKLIAVHARMHAYVDAWIAGEWHAQDVCDPLKVLLLHPACRHGWRTHADAARRQRTPVTRDAVLAERGERAYVRRESRAFNKRGVL
jgi:hypothetical protein